MNTWPWLGVCTMPYCLVKMCVMHGKLWHSIIYAAEMGVSYNHNSYVGSQKTSTGPCSSANLNPCICNFIFMRSVNHWLRLFGINILSYQFTEVCEVWCKFYETYTIVIPWCLFHGRNRTPKKTVKADSQSSLYRNQLSQRQQDQMCSSSLLTLSNKTQV